MQLLIVVDELLNDKVKVIGFILQGSDCRRRLAFGVCCGSFLKLVLKPGFLLLAKLEVGLYLELLLELKVDLFRL